MNELMYNDGFSDDVLVAGSRISDEDWLFEAEGYRDADAELELEMELAI